VVLADDDLACLDQQAGETFFDGRQLDPRPAKQKPAVTVDRWRPDGVGGPPSESIETSPNIAFLARQPDPIL
jgi:hypothetical protein